ncbi:Holliday junction branch migration protein RuvA [Candidatus Nomurabacteria bacterium CG10_big_fil_rev_8_21_14_0_10_35_16]|uniref:Holliday junction branch migration complex subunit RuvA n=1 Tax=Candidatus Nomurabacteria bacterium CG10_big_fil_rev_8_21_14_0_10_35_16 TaxID=1974731 RepID=A0A2H0TD58_9BACT|nr:MAG: Holliday junction branch migration protein RuvA [Candidatus Nomurabacteria bacterium CG10_big_fil_rev_8_21_14_0_10_35_16]
MIALLSGKIISKDERQVVVDVNGVGYRVFTPTSTLEALPKIGEGIILFTYLAVREDALDLYGFLTKREEEFFGLLITVSGIGPKSALNVLSSASVDQLEEAIISGSDDVLNRVAGIGKKTSGRIVLELKTKIKRIAKEFGVAGVVEGIEVLDALSALGFSIKEAREAVQNLPPDTEGVGDKVKEALKLLSKPTRK